MKGPHGGWRPRSGRPKDLPEKHWKDWGIAHDYIALMEFAAEAGWFVAEELKWLPHTPVPLRPSAISAVAAKNGVTERHVVTCINRYGSGIRTGNDAFLDEKPGPNTYSASYHRGIMSTAIGRRLRGSYDLSAPVPDPMLGLLRRLEEKS
jgi:hypothetical protein